MKIKYNYIIIIKVWSYKTLKSAEKTISKVVTSSYSKMVASIKIIKKKSTADISKNKHFQLL